MKTKNDSCVSLIRQLGLHSENELQIIPYLYREINRVYRPGDSVIEHRLTRAFPAERLRELARSTGLVERRRKLDAAALFWALTLGFTAGEDRSFEALRQSYLQCVGLLLVAADVGHRERDRFAVRDEINGAVSVASRGTVFRAHSTKFAYLVAVGAVIGVIDEIDGNDPRPIRVEDRRGQLHEQEVGGELKPASIERVEPLEDSIVAGGLVILGADLSNGALIGAGKDNDRPDVARIEGSPLDPWQGELSDHIRRYSFDVPHRKEAVWLR